MFCCFMLYKELSCVLILYVLLVVILVLFELYIICSLFCCFAISCFVAKTFIVSCELLFCGGLLELMKFYIFLRVVLWLLLLELCLTILSLLAN